MADTAAPTLEEAKETLIANPTLGEEALYGHLDNDPTVSRSSRTASPAPTPAPAPPAPAAAAPEPAPPASPEPTPAPAAEPTPAPEPAPSPTPEPTPGPAAAAPTHPAPEPTPESDPTRGWSDVDKRANELKLRNPDLGLEECITRAKKELGIVEPDPNAPAPEPEKTTAEQLAEIETQLEAAGASEGLLTPEIITLQKQQARLAGQLAVEQSRAEEAARVEAERVNTERAASRDRLVALCAASGQDAQDRNSPIGKAMAAVLTEMKKVDHPDLYAPDAPELIFAKANLRLPPEQRIAMAAPVAPPAPSVVPPNPPSPAPSPAPAGTPQSVLPASPNARSAQPATVIDPGQLPQIIKETPVKDLEQALFPNGSGGVTVRL
jgi:hypothetical protein